MEKYIYKKLSIQYRKNGNEYIDYLLCNDDGYIKSISPRQWKYNQLKDVTNNSHKKECYLLFIKQWRKSTSFSQVLRLLSKYNNKIDGNEVAIYNEITG